MNITLKSNVNFEIEALKIFNYQYNNNKVYNKYCNFLKIRNVTKLEQIPFLPINFLKVTKLFAIINILMFLKVVNSRNSKQALYF